MTEGKKKVSYFESAQWAERCKIGTWSFTGAAAFLVLDGLFFGTLSTASIIGISLAEFFKWCALVMGIRGILAVGTALLDPLVEKFLPPKNNNLSSN